MLPDLVGSTLDTHFKVANKKATESAEVNLFSRDRDSIDFTSEGHLDLVVNMIGWEELALLKTEHL